MRRSHALVALLCPSLAVAGCDKIEEIASGKPKAVRFCESLVKERLASPSSYTYLGHRVFEQKLTHDDYLNELFPNLRTPWKEYQDSRGAETRDNIDFAVAFAPEPGKLTVSLEYETAGASGVETCEWLVFNMSKGIKDHKLSDFALASWRNEILDRKRRGEEGSAGCCIIVRQYDVR